MAPDTAATLFLAVVDRKYEFYTLGRTREEALQLALDGLKAQVFQEVNVDPEDRDLYLHLNFGNGETDDNEPYTLEHLVEYYGCEPLEIEVGTALEYGTDRVLARNGPPPRCPGSGRHVPAINLRTEDGVTTGYCDTCHGRAIPVGKSGKLLTHTRQPGRIQ